MSESYELEREKTESYELGQISQLSDLSEELRTRAGEQWAEASSRTDEELAKQLKALAQEFEDRCEEKREGWKQEYKETDRPVTRSENSTRAEGVTDGE